MHCVSRIVYEATRRIFAELETLIIDWILCLQTNSLWKSIGLFIYLTNAYCKCARWHGTKRNKTWALPSLITGGDELGPRTHSNVEICAVGSLPDKTWTPSPQLICLTEHITTWNYLHVCIPFPLTRIPTPWEQGPRFVQHSNPRVWNCAQNIVNAQQSVSSKTLWNCSEGRDFRGKGWWWGSERGGLP